MALGGIDIGGTKLGVCLGTVEGQVLACEDAPTEGPPGPLLDHAAERLRALAREHALTLDAIGIACPGPFDRRTRRFLEPPNMPAWHHFDLGAWAEARLPAPARCMNDANAAAYAEYRWGGHHASEGLVFLTMSTGFGAGIVLGGRVLEGPRGFAGEVGRVRIAEDGPPGFGAFGTIEGFASGPGIALLAEAEARRCLQAGEKTALHDAGPPDARTVCALAASSDEAARRVTDRSASRIGQLVAILANILEPDTVILGTIAAAHPDLFLPGVRASMLENSVPATAAGLTITVSTLEHRWQRQALAAAAYLSDR